MKKTGLFSAFSLASVLGTLLLIGAMIAPASASESSAAVTTAIVPTASSSAITTASSAVSTTAPTTDATASTSPTETTAPPPVTEPPIVQPEPEIIENSVFLTHSTPLRAGEEVTFTFSCSGEDVRALQGSITYDDTLLTYKGVSTLDSSWLFTVDPSEGKLVYLGLSTEAEGASGVSSLFSLTFTLSADAKTGNAIPFQIADATALKNGAQLTFTGGPCTFLVDRKISDQALLSSLTVEAGTLSPAFDPSVTEYALTVPYDCALLELSAMPCAYAAAELSATALEVGENTITVTVIAESGRQQVYTLTVTRQSDPNYKPSTDSLLVGLDRSDGMLFPAFSPSVTEYMVYLVNDGGITLTPTPAPLGSAESVTLDGKEGATCTLTSVAEDGITQTVYTFTVLRVPTPEQLGQSAPTPSGGTDGQPSAGSPQTDPSPAMQAKIFIALFAAVAVSLFFVGFAVGHVLQKHKAAKPLPSSIDETDSLTASQDGSPSEVTDQPAEEENQKDQ